MKTENVCLHKYLHTLFIATVFINLKNGNNPNTHQLMNGETKYGIFMQWNIT